MRNIIKAENLKYKHSPWKFVFFLIPILPAIIGTVNYQQNIEILQNGWYSLWTQHTLFYAFFFFSPMIAIAASFLWRVEHKGKNWNLYRTSAAPLWQLYLAKCYLLIKLIIAIQIWVAVLFFVAGKLSGLQDFVPLQILWWLLRGTLGAFVIAALQMLFSMMIHNFAIPVLIGFLGGIAGFLFSSAGYGTFFPYSQLMMGMNSNRVEDVLTQGNCVFFLVIAFYLLVLFEVGVCYLRKSDVRTQ